MQYDPLIVGIADVRWNPHLHSGAPPSPAILQLSLDTAEGNDRLDISLTASAATSLVAMLAKMLQAAGYATEGRNSVQFRTMRLG